MPALPVAAFEFLAAGEPRLTERLVRSSAPLGATVVLDLEDALWDLEDEQRTAALKADGRRNLLALAARNERLFAGQPVGVRVNRLRGPDAAEDLEALEALPPGVSLSCVMVTKIESPDDVRGWVEEFNRRAIRYGELVPIVETVAGLANLDAICVAARSAGVRWLVYGHYDFCLDAGWWPFPELDDAEYWRHVAPLVARIEAAGLGFVQPPFFHLRDLDRFAAVLTRLAGVSGRTFGAITLGRAQTAVAARFAPVATAPQPAAAAPGDPIELARRICADYSAKRRGLSFAIDRRGGEFISPHLYLAARRQLDRLERARAHAQERRAACD